MLIFAASKPAQFGPIVQGICRATIHGRVQVVGRRAVVAGQQRHHDGLDPAVGRVYHIGSDGVVRLEVEYLVAVREGRAVVARPGEGRRRTARRVELEPPLPVGGLHCGT